MIFGRRRHRRHAKANILALLLGHNGPGMGAYHISKGARVPYIVLYHALDELLVAGLIADNWVGDPTMRRLYRITEQGRTA